MARKEGGVIRPEHYSDNALSLRIYLAAKVVVNRIKLINII